MIPTSIDGTDITGATIDGTDVQEITVDGQTVFSAGPPDSVVDNFETVPIGIYESGETIADYYSGATGEVSLSTSNVIEGARNAEVTSSQNPDSAVISNLGDGLNAYPEKQDTVRVLMRDDAKQFPAWHFCSAISGGTFDGYAVRLQSNDSFRLRKYSGADPNGENGSDLDIASPSISEGEWYWVEVDIPDSNGSMAARLYDVDTNDLTRGSQLVTVSATDTDFVDNRGVGLGRGQSDNQGYIDGVEIQ